MALQLNYYYGRESEQYSFFRIPKALFTDERYKSLSMESKVLYGLMLDRMALSVKSGWLDDYNRVYIFFTLDDAIETMGYSHTKVVRLFKELDEIGLIERKKQGLGRPTIVYVKNFTTAQGPLKPEKSAPVPSGGGSASAGNDLKQAAYPSHSEGVGYDVEAPVWNAIQGGADSLPGLGSPDFPDLEIQTSQNWKSGFPENGTLEFQNTATIKTEKNKTENIDTESIYPPSSPAHLARDQPACPLIDSMDKMESIRDQIRETIEYDLLCEQHPFDVEIIDGYVELMLEVFRTTRETIRVCGRNEEAGVVKSRFLSLTHEHISYVLDCMNNNTAPISNIKAYTLTALFNAPVTMAQFYASRVSYDMEHGGG